MKKREWNQRIIGVTLALVLVAMTLTGCASDSAQSGAAYDTKMAYSTAQEAPMAPEPGFAADNAAMAAGVYEEGTYEDVAYDEATQTTTDSGNTSSVSAGQKLIKTVNMDVETEDFDELMANLEAKINTLGGYVEYQYTYNGSGYVSSHESRYASITARVPADCLDSFITEVSGITNVVSKNTSTENVTLAYVDTESKKKMFLAEQDSLLALLEQAATVEDVVYLTERLTEVRYNIESMESQLRVYDNLVDYATIILSVQEVEIFTPTVIEEKTTGERIAEGFVTNVKEIGQGFAEFGVWFVINLPNLILFLFWCAVIFFSVKLIIFIIKRRVAKKKANKEKAAGLLAEADNKVNVESELKSTETSEEKKQESEKK